MPSIRILLLGLVSTSLAQYAAEESTAVDTWEEILESLPGESLRAALEGSIHRYQEGVFEDGRNAIDSVRSDDPALAEALVDLAKQHAVVKDHLRKRQATNTTITTSLETVTESSPSSSLVPATPSSGPSSTSIAEPEPTSGQSLTSVPESSPPVDSSTLVVISTPSATSTEIVVPPIVTSTSLISVPASSTVIPPSTSSAEPTSAEPTVAEPTSTTQGQAFPTTTVAPPPSTGLSSMSSSPEQDSSSVVAEPTLETTPTTTAIATVPSPTEPEPTSPETSEIEAPTTQPPTTEAPTDDAPEPTEAPADNDLPTTEAPSTTNVVVDPSGSIVTSVPPLWTATESDGDTIVLTSPTPGAVYTTADQGGDVAVVTYTPDGGTVSEVHFLTTLLPNGSPAVVTSFATINAPAPTSDESSNSDDTEQASLQDSGAALPSTWYALVLGAAIGVAGAVL